jgi:hypothetical protein
MGEGSRARLISHCAVSDEEGEPNPVFVLKKGSAQLVKTRHAGPYARRPNRPSLSARPARENERSRGVFTGEHSVECELYLSGFRG